MRAHTPGPWKFIINPKGKEVDLSTGRGIGRIVMAFRRWGMAGAQPYFCDSRTLLAPAVAFSVPDAGREHHAEWWRVVDHPDARLIEAAPDLLEALEEMLATHPAAFRQKHSIDNRTDAAVTLARVAIAKARGE